MASICPLMGDTKLYSTLMGDSGLRMKIAIPRLEPTTGPIPKRRGRPKKKKTLTVGTSSGTDSSDDAQRTPNRAKPPARQLSGSGGRARTCVKAKRSPSSSSTSSSSDFGSFSGTNGKRSVGRPKIRPNAASTPAASNSTHTTTTSHPPDATPIKRRPGRPPKKVVASPAVDKPPRISEVRLSLADGASSSDNDASQAISAAINRAFESGGSDTELNVNPGVFGDATTSHAKTLAGSSCGGGVFRGEKKSSTTAAKAVLSPIQYTSSLLRDYVEKTQKLGQQQEANVIVPDQTANSLPRESSATNCEVPAFANSIDGVGVTPVRRKRGRPPKKPPVAANEAAGAAAGAQTKTDRLNSRLKLSMRDSPDSGILSVNQSPSHSPRTVKKATASAGRSQSALLSLEKPIYPTERVLYPPRNIKRGRPPANKAKEERPQATASHDSAAAGSSRTEKAPGVDPMWRKIDINKKFQPPTNGYKSDGGGGDTFSGLGAGSSAAGSRGGEGSSAVCSKVLAAQCGYASDYGSVRKSRQSGYRSDYSTKSRKSGYRSDYSVKGGGGCGYRSDCSVRRKLRRKRRPKSSFSGSGAASGIGGDSRGSDTQHGGLTSGSSYLGMCPKPLTTFDERDILQLAGLSLGNSSDDDSGNDVVAVDPKNDRSKEKPGKERDARRGGDSKELICPLRRPIEKFAATSVQFLDFDRAKFEREFIMNYRALVAESRQETEAMEAKINEEAKARLKKADKKSEAPKYNCFESFSNVLPILELKSKRSAKSIRSRRSSAVSRCSSRSNRSMHHKHRRKRLKSKSEAAGPVNKLAEKIRLQLEQIVDVFGKACDLVEEPAVVKAQQKPPVQRPGTPCPVVVGGTGAVAASKESQKETPKTAQKRALKKRKASENAENTSTPSASKRRTKKGQVETQSPDDHKLPLKKRHYLLTDGEKAAKEEEEGARDAEPGEVATEVKAPATPKAKPAPESKVSVPSKRPPSPVPTPTTEHVPMTPRGSRKGPEQQQLPERENKKKKLPSPSTSAPRGRPVKNAGSTAALPSKLLSPVPPPGVFEPTMDLELQIPISTIVISGTGKGGSGLLTVRTKLEKCMDSPSLKKKRKKINRTGFPTVKKKKKRQTPIPHVVTSTTTMPDIMPDLKLEKCDRVPTDGEATSKFLERNDLKQRLAVVSLERLQEAPDVIVTRASRSKDSPVPPKSGSRDVSRDSLVAATPPPTSLPRAAKKVKLEDPVQEEKEKVLPPPPPPPPASDSKKNKRRSVPLKVELPAPKVRCRRATSVERSDTGDSPNSLLDEISPLKRQSIRNLAKSLMVSETKTKDEVIEPLAVVAKKIDPRKRRMTVAVLETPKVRALPPPPPVPIKEESPTALRDIRPAPAASELEQDALPVNEEEEEEEIARTDTPSSEISDRSTSKRAPKWKKKYLPAGLFSEYYKEADKDRTNKTIAKDIDNATITPELLPPPPYCEKFFRQSLVDFQLPHDLWYAHENQKLPGRDTIASWTFKKIRTNVYLDGKPNPKTDLPSCNCKHSSGCVDDCLNRMVYTECNPDTCPCEDKCQNTKIQRHEFAPGIERFMTEKKGWGVRTKQAIRKSQFIIEYLGEVVTEREFKERMGTVYAKDTHHYCLHLDGDLVIDGHRMGSDCRFVNHSCTPNCEVQKWNVNGLSRMCLFALRDIKPGEELTYDYNFALYNPSEGQPCKCDSKDCRGVIGGKSQRITKPPVEQKTGASAEDAKGVTSAARNRKRQAKKKHQSQQMNKVRPTTPLFQVPTCKEIAIIRESHCFMIRNLMKVRKQKDVMSLMQSAASDGASSGSGAARRTRAIKCSEETDENVVQLRLAFLRMTSELLEMKKEANDLLMTLPPRKKNPKYYERFERPIDLTTIHGNADKWVYSTVHSFDEDMLRMLRNAMDFFEVKSEEHAAAEELQKAYEAKKWAEYQSLSSVVTSKELLRPFEPPATNELELKVEPNEDIIRCICGLFKDEGLMIECAKCQVWQHAECTRADLEVEHYLCERCEPRDVDLEITIDEYSDEGYQYYLSLMRGSLQIRQTDTVYVLRDIPMTPDKTDPEKKVRKHTYETIGRIDYGDCDIFRVERLWKDKDGKRFVFGHHYLRPHETYHEPSRKFYPNEVVRVPLYEVVPIELIIDRCWVLDTTTYCKGRPVDSVEEHVYICELRVDKGARLFSKISKQANPVCVKSYAFKKFKQKLKISKSYAPHDHAPAGRGSSTPIPAASTASAAASSSMKKEKKRKQDVPIASRKNSTSIVQLRPPPPKTLQEKRQRLDATLTRLMAVQRSSNPGAPEMDLSYLLTGRGARTKSSRAISNAVVTSIT